MITAVDTSILVDVFIGDPRFGPRSAEALRVCLSGGAVVVSGIVLAEILPLFQSSDEVTEALAQLTIRATTVSLDSFIKAGEIWRAYRQSGGPRTRVVADFLIGAHALVECDRLLTRDRGFYRSYFKKLRLIEP